MIIAVATTIFSGCAANRYAVAGNDKIGLPFGTILTIGGQKMIVVSKETEEVKLKPYTIVKETPSVSMTGVETENLKGDKKIKPEWESKKVVTEGVKTVQECHDPRGCPQDVTTGECLEGCSEQKVKVEMTETIVTPEIKVAEVKPVSDTFDPELLFATLLRIDDPYGNLRRSFKDFYGKPEWICIMIENLGDLNTKIALTKLLYSNPKFVQICNTSVAFAGGTGEWIHIQEKHSF